MISTPSVDIAVDDFQYGTVRMAQGNITIDNVKLEVFRRRDEANAWLAEQLLADGAFLIDPRSQWKQ